MKNGEAEDRVLFVEHRSSLGGGQRMLLELAGGLGEGRSVVAVSPGAAYRDVLTERGVRTLTVRMPRWRRPGWIGGWLSAGIGAIGPWWSLYRLIGREGINLVHANCLFALLTALPPAKLRGVPVLGHIHSFDGLDHRAAGSALRRADMVVAVCKAMADEIEERWHLPPERLTTVPNGIDIEAVVSAADRGSEEIGSGPPLIGTITTFHPDKGFDILLEALYRLKAAGVDFTAAIIGDGPGRTAAGERAAELGLNDKIHWLGYRSEPYGLMRRFDLYVCPSRIEAMPIAILEAAALGVPVLASSVGGIPEMIDHGATGWLVPPSDPVALAGAMERLLSDKELRTKLTDAARRRVRRDFSARRMAADFRRLYGTLSASN